MDFFESDNFNAEQIAEEREHLALTIERIKEQIAALESDGFSFRAVNMYDEQEVEEYRTEKFLHDERQYVARVLRGALSTPYFARMKLKQIASSKRADTPSMTRKRELCDHDELPVDVDIYVGQNVIFYRDEIIVYSHNSPLGNRVYDRFEGGVIEYGGYTYEVIFRRKFDIRGGKLEAVFQDYSKENGGVVYDKFLAHMMRVKRGDKRLTDIIPTIQANQNAIITRPADENAVVYGCAGCGKTMILLQRLEYLSFNKKIELSNAVIVCPSERYKVHIQPVVDDLMIGAARRVTLGELYRELILSMTGVGAKVKRLLGGNIVGDEEVSSAVLKACYGDEIKRKLISALKPVKQAYLARLEKYRAEMIAYEREVDYARRANVSTVAVKPKAPVVDIDLNKLGFLPALPPFTCKAKLYLLLTAYCYVLGKPRFYSALFIDEGQEYYINEYRLLAECTNATVNVYGDDNQQLDPECGIGSLDKIRGLWNMSSYSLNENYRNAREITAFVNNLLGMSVTSLGLDGGQVREMRMEDISSAVEEAVRAGDRVAVVYSPSDDATRNALYRLGLEKYALTVKESKGLEYERVFACGELTDREKYVAYTRALNNLCIIPNS